MHLYHTLQSVLTGIVLLCSLPAHAEQAQQLYDVEVIIFSYNDPADQGEVWRQAENTPTTLTMPGPVAAGRFTRLTSRHYQLNPVKYSLQQGADNSVLLHHAWRQTGYSPSLASGYPIHAKSGDGLSRVEGSVRLERGRYLHLEVDLLLQQDTLSATGLYSIGSADTQAFRLREKRRIKSSELHYFDHPRFGLLAMVTPFTPEVAPAQEETGEQQADEADASAADETTETPAASPAP